MSRIALLVALLALSGCGRSFNECFIYGYEYGIRFQAATGASEEDRATIATAAQERCEYTPTWKELK